MATIHHENKMYQAFAPRKHEGINPYTCDAWRHTQNGIYRVKSQALLFTLSKILRGLKP